MESRRTPLHAEHEALGAMFTDFAGWRMPLRYDSELAEHHAVRKTAGLFDLTHMGEIVLTGPEAGAALDYALVGHSSAIGVGRARYTMITQADGGVLDDLIVYRLGDVEYLVVANASNAELVFGELVERAKGFDTTVVDKSQDYALLAVQGPASTAILAGLTPTDLATVKYYASYPTEVAGVPVLLARTGYTGEDGFEIFVDSDAAAALWQALLAVAEDGELTPAGLASRDSLRLEAGMPLYGNELSLEGDPFAAGLGPVVALSKEGDFVGKAALAAKKAAGAGSTSGRKLVGLKGLGRRAGRGHYPVLKDGNVVGDVTSGQPSPSLGYPVAMAYVDVEFTEPGTALDIDLRGKSEPFEIVALPFYKRAK